MIPVVRGHRVVSKVLVAVRKSRYHMVEALVAFLSHVCFVAFRYELLTRSESNDTSLSVPRQRGKSVIQ